MNRTVTLQVGVHTVVTPGSFFKMPVYKYRWFEKLYDLPPTVSVNEGFEYVTKNGTEIGMRNAKVHHDGSVKIVGFNSSYNENGLVPVETQVKTLEDDGFIERQ